MSYIEIKVPALGESITEATIAKWLKSEGEVVEKDEVIVELETDKVTQEIYAPSKGSITEILFQEDQDVKVGQIIAKIESLEETKKSNQDVSGLNQTKESNQNLNSSSEEFKIIIPALGESITEATIGKWIKNEGDNVNKGEPVVEIETDKVTQELYAEKQGKLKKIFFKDEEDVKIGETIGIIEIGQLAQKKIEISPNIEIEKKEIKKTIDLDPSTIKRSGRDNKININDLKEFIGDVSFSPSARRYINENDIEFSNYTELTNTGRLAKADFIENKSTNNISDKTSIEELPKKLSDEIRPLSKVRQSIAKRLKTAQNTAAMLTTFNEIDMQNVMQLRKKYKDYFIKKYDVKLGFMSFFTKASIVALKEIPEVNAEIRGDDIIYKNRYDIGVAVGTEKGLFVPVVRDADKMSFAEIEKKIIEYGGLAKQNKISLDHMKDGTFTISNGGVYGSMLSTPILNSPQSGILGLHNIVKRPVVVNDEITVRPIMYVALTYDHRIIDGKQAVTFLVRLKQIIENPEELMFDI